MRNDNAKPNKSQEQNKAVSENKTLHRFYYLILQTPHTKSASDFAAIELANKM